MQNNSIFKKFFEIYSSIISIFTIPGTISFTAFVILLVHFGRNNFKADNIVIELLALIVINFHLPKILDTITETISRTRNVKLGNVKAEFGYGKIDSGGLTPKREV